MWVEAVVLVAAFLVAILLILLQDRLLGRETASRPRPEKIRSEDEETDVTEKIREIVSQKGQITVDELSDLLLSDASSAELSPRDLEQRLAAFQAKAAKVLEDLEE